MPHLPDSGFDKVAPFYDRLAKLVFGNAQQQAQHFLLQFIPQHARVLIIGGGSGWVLEQVLKYSQASYILYLEASPNMLRLAQQRYQHAGIKPDTIVEFRLGTEAELRPADVFDVILTPFLLDLFPPQRLYQLMLRLNTALSANGLWLFTDFWLQPTPPFWQQLLVKSMYLFFGTVSGVKANKLPDYQKHFEELNLQQVASESFFHNMIKSKVYRRQA
ncbi:class I SAM-dependent methyltransferase [Pontibacter vulgaris]|uniref:class I SAM-dependent methyltransferase n=1 Tax=Pontibacter vulgaris TaxID=2905679 RepID=UPI001FA77133|nr:class I SAM-dependent methyltransferase [Pontibacter vulgaris]